MLFFPIPDGMHTMKGRASLANGSAGHGTRSDLSRTLPKTSGISISTCVYSADLFHEGPDRDVRPLGLGDVAQRPRPFADCLAIDFIVTRAANDGTEWVCVLVEGKIGKFKGMPQKLLVLRRTL